MKIAVLALQGAFAEHEKMLEELGAETFEIRQKSDLRNDFDGLIIPGGESTVMSKLLKELDIFDEIQEKIKNGLPVFGTCAGLILLAKKVEGGVPSLQVMDITACRNAYGRQLGSFKTNAEFKGLGKIDMTFIRAPYIKEVFGEAEKLAEVDGRIVAARQKNILATAFHPELCESGKVHEYFLKMCKGEI